MESISERRAFARAWSYLNYHAVAKWTALVAAVVAGVLYVLLLIVLWLFGDLMVHRGQIPAYDQLSRSEQDAFDQYWLMPVGDDGTTRGDDALHLLNLDKTRTGDKDLANLKPSDDK